MKKGLSAAFIVVILLLLSTYFMGEKVQKETKKFFTQQSEKGISYKLINYDKGFFASRLKSEITVQVDSGPGVTFIIDTLIKHYPYKATLSSQVKFTSAMLNKKAKQYFSTSQWLSSEMQVSLLGTVTGDVNIVSGAYKSEQEKFSNKALSFNYSLNLSDYSGAFTLDLAYFNAESNSLTIQLENLFLSSHFNTLSIRESSQYLFRVQDIRSKIKNGNFHIKDFLIKGDSKASKDGDKINSNNQLKMAYYQFGSPKNIYTESEIKLNFTGVDAEILDELNKATEDDGSIERILIKLIQKGFNLDFKDFKTTTPWGEMAGALDLSVQEGIPLSKIISNPFMLLDYVEGDADITLSNNFMQEPMFEFVLQLALNSELLKQQEEQLTLHAQLKKGELVVNGKQVPL